MVKLGYFKAFFGIGPDRIRKTAVISPIIYPSQACRAMGREVKEFRSILGYVAANFRSFTFIKTPMTQGAVADLIALLKKTPCRKLIFLGAAGGIGKGSKIGDIISTDRASHVYSFDSIHKETRQKLLALRKKGVLGIDLESRAFFSAAKKAGIPAAADYVVTDLPLKRPFYLKLKQKEKMKIKEAICHILKSISASA